MKIAFVIFDGMTALDFVGVFDPLTRLKTMGFRPDVAWDVCAPAAMARDGAGLVIAADRAGQTLTGYDMVVVPGGFATRGLVHDAAFVGWLKTAADCPLKVSVCTGALLLGAAGFLAGKPATTHPAAFADLAPYCGAVREERVVDAGDTVTAGGVTAALDLGLYLCERLAGAEVTAKIRRQMDYRCPG